MTMKQLILAVGLMAFTVPAAFAQATVATDAKPNTEINVKAVSSSDLKEAISYAVQSGDLDPKDGKELIDKIVDIETLMEQFDFIRDHERSMMSSVGSSFH